MSKDMPAAQLATITEAADWHARLRSASVSEVDAMRFRAWLARSPANREEFEKMDGMLERISALGDTPEITASRARPRSGLPWAMAAAVFLGVAGLSWLVLARPATYGTSIGEQRIIPLPDGSVVTLNTATRIRVEFSPTQRGVELISGQANFKVAKDTARPFVVTAGGGEVRALGTVFDVYRLADRVMVTLIEGKVAVRSAEQAPAVMAVGEQLSYDAEKGVIARRSADLARTGAWRARKLDFSNTPVLEAIAEANRYSRLQIVLDAPRIENARISGTFEAGRNDLFIEGLQSYFGLAVAPEAEGRVVLSAPH